MASGASTVPEQMTASLLGVRCVAFATVSNPATGTVEHYVHDQDSILELGAKCIVNLKKTLWRIIEKFEFNPQHRVRLNLHA